MNYQTTSIGQIKPKLYFDNINKDILSDTFALRQYWTNVSTKWLEVLRCHKLSTFNNLSTIKSFLWLSIAADKQKVRKEKYKVIPLKEYQSL